MTTKPTDDLSLFPDEETIEKRFVREIMQHLQGFKEKMLRDFAEGNFDLELKNLHGDPVYADLHFDCAEYVAIRLMGRLSISVGRRIGELYDKIPRLIAAARFELDAEKIAWKVDGLLLDVGLRLSDLKPTDRQHVIDVMSAHLLPQNKYNAIGIEIRYNFNPNDSARLRKDVDMATGLKAINATPVYLVYSSISPRDEAIARLKKAGWQFLIGADAYQFTHELFGVDLPNILKEPTVSAQIEAEVKSIMDELKRSYVISNLTT